MSDPFIRAWAPGTRPEWAEEPGQFATEAIPPPAPAPSVPVRVEIDMLAIDDDDAAAIGRRVLDMMGATWPTLRVVQAVRVVRR